MFDFYTYNYIRALKFFSIHRAAIFQISSLILQKLLRTFEARSVLKKFRFVGILFLQINLRHWRRRVIGVWSHLRAAAGCLLRCVFVIILVWRTQPQHCRVCVCVCVCVVCGLGGWVLTCGRRWYVSWWPVFFSSVPPNENAVSRGCVCSHGCSRLHHRKPKTTILSSNILSCLSLNIFVFINSRTFPHVSLDSRRLCLFFFFFFTLSKFSVLILLYTL